MIKANKQKVRMQGTGAKLCTELTIIVRALYEDIAKDTDENFAKFVVERAFRLGMAKPEEIEKEFKEGISRILKDLSEAEDAEAVYAFVEDEDELDSVFRIFEQMMEDVDIER